MGALIPIEPDHLCSLIALNAGQTKVSSALIVGIKWGAGHSLGMLTFCLLFLPFQSMINLDVWEFYGNYVAGGLLIGIGIYFLCFESKYLELGSDGSWQPRQAACSCCYHSHPSFRSSSLDGCDHGEDGHATDPESECTPLVPHEEKRDVAPKTMGLSSLGDFWQTHIISDGGALVGALQGLCCPSCIAGLAFVGQLGSQHPRTGDIMLFFSIMFISILACSGLVSSSVVAFGQSFNFCCSLSTRTMFRGACIFSIAMGTAWVILNACGMLHVIEYTHGMHDQMIAQNEDMQAMALHQQHEAHKLAPLR